MQDSNRIRRQVQLARELAKQGKYMQAKQALRGIDHPKVEALLVVLESRMPPQLPPSERFPLGRVLGVAAFVLVLVVGGGVLLGTRSPASATPPTLPTLMPTDDCTPETVRLWWQTQDSTLSDFAAAASSASRTMPGERLEAQLAALRAVRDAFPPLPSCATPEVRLAVGAVLTALDDTIRAAEHWNSGTADGTQATTEFYAAETALREGRAQVGAVIR